MKKTIGLQLLLSAFLYGQNPDFPRLTGPYLGQKSPGKISEFFADGLVANTQHSFHTNIVFTPTGDEAFWATYDSNGKNKRILQSKLLHGVWMEPQTGSFSLIDQGDDAPFVSPDGRKVFFLSRRPISSSVEPGKENIWFVERTADGWTEAKPLPPVVNSMRGIHWQISVDGNENLYFSTCENLYAPVRAGDIYCSKNIDERYTEPVKLSSSVNGDGYNCCPYVSPDGGSLLFTREDPISHKMRIWISFRKPDEDWTEGMDLSGWIGGHEQTCPVLTWDGRYLFFLRYVNSFCQPFWMDGSFVDKMRNREFVKFIKL